MSKFSVDINEILIRIIKYIVEGTMVGIAALCIPKNKITPEEVLTIALSASAIFSVLDTFSPSISAGARSGSGLALGGGVVGGFPTR